MLLQSGGVFSQKELLNVNRRLMANSRKVSFVRKPDYTNAKLKEH